MKRFVEFSLWDYMDEFPRKEVRVFEGSDEQEIENHAKEFCKHMSKAYSGGTTDYVGIMDQKNAEAFVDETVTKETVNPQEDSEEWIACIRRLYTECYNL